MFFNTLIKQKDITNIENLYIGNNSDEIRLGYRQYHINRHIIFYRIIDEMKLPVTHQTKRSGRPYQLILKKTNQLFSQDKERFKQITKSVNQLIASGYVKSIK